MLILCFACGAALFSRRKSAQNAVKGTPLDNPNLRGLPNRLIFLSCGTCSLKWRSVCLAAATLYIK